ncbi:trypsin [Streptomyces sp. HB202]|nr:trypsin [Streptomyces sp. HB202]
MSKDQIVPRTRPRAALFTGLLATSLAVGVLTATPAQALSGTVVANGTHTFTAKVEIGEGDTKRACTGALIDPRWVVSASSCFTTGTATLVRGKPAGKATATIGRTDLTSTGGHVSEIVEVVPYEGRDLVMARLAAPAAGISPVGIATTPATVGTTLTAVGYGRTQTEWVPNKLHTGSFLVNAVTGPALNIVGASAGSAICKGDAGGPVLRQDGGTVALAGVSGASWQGGCIGETETRTDAVAARTDDLKPWIDEVIAGATDFNCDGARDVAIADPDAAVNGAAKAGRVQLVYGGREGQRGAVAGIADLFRFR